jgi:hypothetical protein
VDFIGSVISQLMGLDGVHIFDRARVMIMWKLKSCPKCSGDLFRRADEYGEYVSCLQCGKSWELDVGLKLPKRGGHELEHPPQVEDGCAISETCLECPLEQCVHEARINIKAYLRDEKLREAVGQLRQQGCRVVDVIAQIAEEHQVSQRCVYRALERRNKHERIRPP